MTLNSIIANFQTFKLADLLDIVIIAFLIYQLLGIINRTRAGQLAKGALLVLAVYLVANVLNMRTVTWLLNSLLQVGLLTLVAPSAGSPVKWPNSSAASGSPPCWFQRL